MRVRSVTAIVVFLACVAFIAWSTEKSALILDEMDKLSMVVIDQVLSSDLPSAMDTLGEMAVKWESERTFMEIIMPHEDLQSVIELFTEAKANLQARDADDFSRSIALLRETLDHLRYHEKFSWSNIL